MDKRKIPRASARGIDYDNQFVRKVLKLLLTTEVKIFADSIK